MLLHAFALVQSICLYIACFMFIQHALPKVSDLGPICREKTAHFASLLGSLSKGLLAPSQVVAEHRFGATP